MPTRQRVSLRITSACAESTERSGRPRMRSSDHLRLRGEHLQGGPVRAGAVGSPPPARRAPVTRNNATVGKRITSACAESTPPRSAPPPAAPDHLRLRGEHIAESASAPWLFGSPPPARRARRRRNRADRRRRITSACAESTPRRRRRTEQASDHLRLRGEHGTSARVSGRCAGSPPPARRARPEAGPGSRRDRITSACAESTGPAPCARLTRPDHLRLRGEHGGRSKLVGKVTGSPPPARRAPGPGPHPLPRARITSACAESTAALPRSRPR